MSTDRHLIPNTAEWHAFNVGWLITNLQELEYSARIAVAMMSGAPPTENLLALRRGDVVPETFMTNYDQLRAVLKKFNDGASARHRLKVQRLVALRDQFAHGRIVATASIFSLTLVKFERPVDGQVPVAACIEMTEAWFEEQRLFVCKALQAVADEQTDWRRRQG